MKKWEFREGKRKGINQKWDSRKGICDHCKKLNSPAIVLLLELTYCTFCICLNGIELRMIVEMAI